ncbi:MAG: DUF1353 domain-containing protein [Desulfocapsaceae bacterium]|nr:DUF1353 domain-containing protein [Desulfocapsaceae bacterium]
MSNHGFFSEDPKTLWITDPDKADRNMELLADFSYTDPQGRVWLAPKGSTINGASIPRPLWSTVGSPYTDDYRRASITHDVACNTPGIPRKEADVMFFHACRAGGCNAAQARVLYAGVRIGAWASASIPKHTFSRDKLLFRTHISTPFNEELFLKGKLSDISNEMDGLSDDTTIEQLDNIIERHIKF